MKEWIKERSYLSLMIAGSGSVLKNRFDSCSGYNANNGRNLKFTDMKKITEIENDAKKAHSVVKALVKKAINAGIKDGSSVYVRTWTPKKGWHFAHRKFNYYHKVHGLYPNISDKIGAVGNLAQNNYVIKKSQTSEQIQF